ncbi:hypothetical protein MMC11_008065 [Xylographa trunciseda]|nr:hypothetical protein [Xylographa trunciseda]
MPALSGEFALSAASTKSESTTRTNFDSPSSSYRDAPVDARTNLLPISPNREQIANSPKGMQRDVVSKHMDRRPLEQTSRTKHKNHFYGDAFPYRESITSVRDRLSRTSPIIAEIKTNVIVSTLSTALSTPMTLELSPLSEQIEDEHTFMCEFSGHVAQRFQRSIDSVVLTLNHSACLIYGGTFDPAYILTITALSPYVQPTTNKRNATLIQAFLAEILKVPEHRGIIRFVAVAEDNYATGGITMTGEVQNSSKAGVKDTVHASHQSEQKVEPQKHSRTTKDAASRSRNVPKAHAHNGGAPRQSLSLQSSQVQHTPSDKQAEKAQTLGTRKSILHLLGR